MNLRQIKRPVHVRRHAKPLKQERGVALVVVMLIVAIVTVLAVEMSARQQLNIARTVNIKSSNQAYWFALGAEQFAQNSLLSLKALTTDNINLSQPWVQEFQYPIENGLIEAKLSDMQACFNLNAVNSVYTEQEQNSSESENTDNEANNSNQSNQNRNNQNRNLKHTADRALQRLLENYIDDAYLAEKVRDSIIDWVDEDDVPTGLGAEDIDYESLPIPYLPANNPMSHISEIRLINGMDELLQQTRVDNLMSVFCVLPETSLKINVNTITEENAIILDALLGETVEIGSSIVSSRPQEGFASVQDFLGLSEVRDIKLSPEQLQWFDVTTQYFKLEAKVVFQQSQFKMATVFRVEDGGISVVSREFGGAF